ncbi:hypothetical protein ISCGN_005047 [Ixodes scapularis]
MAEELHELTPTGQVKRPDITLLCKWIINAWKEIPAGMVHKSFQKCFISNRLEEYEDKLLSFQKYVIELRREHGYTLSQIGNVDQTSVWFDSPENCTVNAKGQKSVLVRTTGAERQRCTVMLCIPADGRKLPPYVIFKRKTIPA